MGSLADAAEIGADAVNLTVDNDWLDLHDEEVLEPALEIVDPHHHLWDRPDFRYLTPDLLADITGGHNITATVYMECGAAYRSYGPVELRPVGETEIVAAAGSGWESGQPSPRINAGIVGYADLLLGGRVKPVLQAHIELGRGRFRGIRHITTWDPAPSVRPVRRDWRPSPVAGMMGERSFREGFACLEPLNLTFDAWLFHPQLPELVDLARAFPGTGIVLNHIGGPIGVGPFRSKADEALADWRASIAELAGCPNVSVKLGGLGMRLLGFEYRERAKPPSSADLEKEWRPFMEHCIACFGPERCMFESNFPVDKAYYSYRAAWNAFKRIAAGASADEKRSLFSGTATRIYRL